jgi:hypothetical protein
MATYERTEAGTWRAQVARKGVRKSATFETKAAARQWAEAFEAEILAGSQGQYPRKTVADALTRYAKEVSPKKRTGGKEELRIEAFKREKWAEKWLIDLTADDLGRWRDERLQAVQGESIRRDLTVLSAVFSQCIKEWKWLGSNPVSDMQWPAKGKPRTRKPSWREIKAICRSCGYVTGQALVFGRLDLRKPFRLHHHVITVVAGLAHAERFGRDQPAAELHAAVLRKPVLCRLLALVAAA